MAKEIRICLSTSQWEELELHLAAEYVCTKHADSGKDLDCRTVSDQRRYEMLVETARTHCPHLVPLIEKQVS
jgi:hypothetical protein